MQSRIDARIPAYIQQRITEEEYKAFKKLDIGDIVGIRGTVFAKAHHFS